MRQKSIRNFRVYILIFSIGLIILPFANIVAKCYRITARIGSIQGTVLHLENLYPMSCITMKSLTGAWLQRLTRVVFSIVILYLFQRVFI